MGTGNRGVIHQLEGNIDEAVEAYKVDLATDPDNPTVLNNLGLALAQKGRLEEAESYLRRAIELHPGSSMAHANLGNVLALRGDGDGAVRHLREAVACDPQNVLAWDTLGRLFLSANKPDEAAHVWAEAIRLCTEIEATHRSLLHIGLGMALVALDRAEAALSHLHRAVSLDPESVDGWTQLGVLLFLRRDFGSAEDALKRALALNPDASKARRYVAQIHLILGDRREARLQLERALRGDPQNVKVRIDLAVLALSEGHPEQALEVLDQVDTTRSDESIRSHLEDRFRFYRGVALDQLGRVDEALELLQSLAQQVFGKYAPIARRYLAERK